MSALLKIRNKITFVFPSHVYRVLCQCDQISKFFSDGAFVSNKKSLFSHSLINRVCGKYSVFEQYHVVLFERKFSFSKNRCWKCNAVVTERDIVCLSCGSIQEPNRNLNYFEIFKESPHFAIDVRNLTVKFRRLQTLMHPDKFATRSEKEQQYSSEQSSRVNKAYQTLYDPMERGLYLLELNGKPLLDGELEMPADFLLDIMEINETLSECLSAECVEPIRHKNDAKLEILFSSLSVAFKEKNFDCARELLAKIKYYMSIDSRIQEIEEKLGISRDI